MKAALVLGLGLSALSAHAPAQEIALESRFAPRLDRTDSGISVRYELHVVNRGKADVELRALQVRDAATGATLLTLTGDRLRAAIAPGRGGCDPVRHLVSPGSECLVYVDTDRVRAVPGTLRNRITFLKDGSAGRADLIQRAADDSGPTLGPPLGAGLWVAVHHPDWPRGHRRVFYPSPRGEVLPGRFAIDFVKVASTGATSCGDPDRPSDALGYGDPVLAVAGGRIEAARDGIEESRSISANRAHDAATAPGNYVVLNLGRGKFATYEHLRPGSIRVRAGQLVRRGAILGELGFTGDSTGPHLHFHVSDSASPLGGEGLPFVFDRFSLWGDYPDIAQLGRERWRSSPRRTVASARPGPNSVISFAPLTPAKPRSGSAPCAASEPSSGEVG